MNTYTYNGTDNEYTLAMDSEVMFSYAFAVSTLA